MISKEAEKILYEILAHESTEDYWTKRIESADHREEIILIGCLKELESEGMINFVQSIDDSLNVTIQKDGYLYKQHKEEQEKAERKLTMSEFEKKLTELLERARTITPPSQVVLDGEETRTRIMAVNEWMDDVQIFYSKYLTDHALRDRINTLLIHRKFVELVAALTSISKDKDYIDKMNGGNKVTTTDHQTKQFAKFDVFISHANKDKEELVEELYQSLNKLGVSIFYDKESLEWGDNWKDRILNGTKKAEFAIIVISENFFDREWTERELSEFLNRQNRNGQKLILPIIHNITMQQLQEKYPNVADIQAIDSNEHNCDQIALLFARQLIKRLKTE